MSEFKEYMASFWDNYFFWIGLLMLIADMSKKFIPKLREMPRWLFVSLAVLCLFIASFQSWREEHEKVVGQRTYIKVGGPSNIATVIYQPDTRPFLALAETNGDFVAKHFTQHAELILADMPYPNALADPREAIKVEEQIYDDYRAKLDMSTLSYEDVEPHAEFNMGARLDHLWTEDDLKALHDGNKALMFLGFVYWGDAHGRHEKEVCQVLNMSMGSKLGAQTCSVHDGYIDEVKGE
jgi:hypothetical protein